MKKIAHRASVLPGVIALALAFVSLPAGAVAAVERPPAVAAVERPPAANAVAADAGPEAAPAMPVTPKPSPSLALPPAVKSLPTGTAGMDPATASTDATSNGTYARDVFNLMNVKRTAARMPPLRWNQGVANVSQAWANHLGTATKSANFDWGSIHRSDGGGSMIPSGANWYGEIIAFNFTAANIVNWWMGSPSHKAAMLDSRESDTGVGVVIPTSGPYKGWHLVVANLAGYPASVTPAAKPKPPVSPFRDLVAGQMFLKEMNWMASRKISTGYPGPHGTKTYLPLERVKRDAMAAFMYRLAGSPSYTPPKTSPFADVKRGQQFYKEICWLASKKISTGYPGPHRTKLFKSLQPVNRDAMAAFMYRLAGSPSYRAPKTSPFVDVKKTQAFSKEIAWLAAEGISTGWAGTHRTRTFRSLQPVNRDAMAAFMYRWAN